MQNLDLKKPKILIVDDEVAMVRSLELLMRPIGDVVKAYSVPEAEEALADHIDCVITDVCMPEASGLTLLEKIRNTDPSIPVIVMTAYSSVPEAVEAIQMGAFEYITKPFQNADIVSCVKRALEKKGMTAGETQGIPSGWVCNSQAMQDFLKKADKLVSTVAPVLIVGERGVGKRRLSRWLHERGLNKTKDLLYVDTGVRDEDSPLLNSDLSSVGSIFVPEVFSLSKRGQDKLMELIRSENLRVVASCTSALEVQSSSDYRADLIALLRTHVLEMPSLVDRKDDFEALCSAIIETTRDRMRLKKLEVSGAALEKLKAHSYVGNIKELEQLIERAAIECNAGIVQEKDLKFEQPNLSQQLPFSIPVDDGWGRLEFLTKSLERDLILRSLEEYPDHSNSQIASILGTTRRILELRMKTYKIREG